ncbi:uncharacterized protein EV420DRAFT_1635194 [Desarmillaria tabescens]|uniref:Uncharacterized protein n=1 Tax=Armillaria tabescens TaxID=1929756 RepID=A0AA39NLN6_ARMTA|nr:uncharacterized protein EV420DRAFT_1635194 [Desarmillaria tabescens]KAK0467926.1 hypothetical protein EV420DRAFT_1635194 [Desarmillaria tabescens]
MIDRRDDEFIKSASLALAHGSSTSPKDSVPSAPSEANPSDPSGSPTKPSDKSDSSPPPLPGNTRVKPSWHRAMFESSSRLGAALGAVHRVTILRNKNIGLEVQGESDLLMRMNLKRSRNGKVVYLEELLALVKTMSDNILGSESDVIFPWCFWFVSTIWKVLEMETEPEITNYYDSAGQSCGNILARTFRPEDSISAKTPETIKLEWEQLKVAVDEDLTEDQRELRELETDAKLKSWTLKRQNLKLKAVLDA